MQIEPSSTAGAPPLPGDDARRAVQWLVDRYAARLYSLAKRLCGNAADAEDMVQEVFLQAQRRWGTYRGEASATAWLFAIAARACKTRVRRKGGIDRRVPAFSQLVPWEGPTLGDRAAATARPEAGALRAEATGAILDAICGLSEAFRLPILFRDVLGLSAEDTGAALGLRAGTVKTRVHRARLMVRRAMMERGPTVRGRATGASRKDWGERLSRKLAAMDEGGGGAGGDEGLCAFCRGVLAELDLAHALSAGLASGSLPRRLRAQLLGGAGALPMTARAGARR